MTGKREAAHRELKQRLHQAAKKRITEKGLANLRARDVTADAGCALGSLYTCFDDLDALVTDINTETMEDLHEALSKRILKADTPPDRLEALALGYLDFATKQGQRWSAVFEHQLPAPGLIPDEHREQNLKLLSLIEGPLRDLHPELSKVALATRARTYFSAIHGVVSIALEERFISVSPQSLRRELRQLVSRFAKSV
eukprot:s1_g1439.t1